MSIVTHGEIVTATTSTTAVNITTVSHASIRSNNCNNSYQQQQRLQQHHPLQPQQQDFCRSESSNSDVVDGCLNAFSSSQALFLPSARHSPRNEQHQQQHQHHQSIEGALLANFTSHTSSTPTLTELCGPVGSLSTALMQRPGHSRLDSPPHRRSFPSLYSNPFQQSDPSGHQQLPSYPYHRMFYRQQPFPQRSVGASNRSPLSYPASPASRQLLDHSSAVQADGAGTAAGGAGAAPPLAPVLPSPRREESSSVTSSLSTASSAASTSSSSSSSAAAATAAAAAALVAYWYSYSSYTSPSRSHVLVPSTAPAMLMRRPSNVASRSRNVDVQSVFFFAPLLTIEPTLCTITSTTPPKNHHFPYEEVEIKIVPLTPLSVSAYCAVPYCVTMD